VVQVVSQGVSRVVIVGVGFGGLWAARALAGVLLNWAWNYIFFERAVRLILPPRL